MALATGLVFSGHRLAARSRSGRHQRPGHHCGRDLAGQGVASVYYAPLAARLRADGYQAFIFGLPQSGLGDARDAAAALNAFSDRVRAQTGAAKVDLIAHSQGAMISRYYIKNLGGAGEVDSLVSLGGVMYGTSLREPRHPARRRQLPRHYRLRADVHRVVLPGQPEHRRRHHRQCRLHTNIVTSMDEIIIPYTNGYLNNDGNNVNTNVRSPCWARVIGHISIALDGAVYSGIQDALAHRAISYNCWAL